ncbi:ParB/RepB/Spo0J family partition protein [Kitasatospora sp. NPDC059088]|uniref:ParB/RepB/Spo0J family partition protein n=1 Tax=Kitasatospora sp. NPDC059088 TaxID=3346722 RepID=UPI0036C567C6
MTATMIEATPEAQDTINPQEAADQATTEDEGLAHDVGTLEYHFPEDLVLDEYNHRKKHHTEPDAKLKASVRDLGVQDPVGARPQESGKLGIYKGQRRWKAQLIANREAVKRGQPRRRIPVLVRRDLAGVDDDTLVLSMIENTHREQSSKRDVTDGLTQLALMDMSDAKRAKQARRLGYKPAEVAAANRAAQLSDEVLERLGTDGWDIVEQAEYAEVESVSDALWELNRARRDDQREGNKKRGHWEQAMAKLRARAAEAEKRAQITAELEAAGIPLVRPQWRWEGPVRPLSHLLNAVGKKMTAKAHAEICPDHAAYIDNDKPRAVYVCRNWSGNGHSLTPEEAAKATTETAEDKEAAKAERKRVIQGNKDWRAAREVRTAFLVRLINPGKDDPKEVSDAAWQWIMKATMGETYWFPRFFSSTGHLELVAKLLKVEPPKEGWSHRDEEPFARVIARRGRPGRAFLLLAKVAAAFERENMHDGAWRNPSREVAAWLEFLAGEGYTLADCERQLIDTIKAADEARQEAARKSDAEVEEELEQALAEAREETGHAPANTGGEASEPQDEETGADAAAVSDHQGDSEATEASEVTAEAGKEGEEVTLAA